MRQVLRGILMWLLILGIFQSISAPAQAQDTDPRFPLFRGTDHEMAKPEFKNLVTHVGEQTPVLAEFMQGTGFPIQQVDLHITAATTTSQLEAIAVRLKSVRPLLDLVFSLKNSRITGDRLIPGLEAQRNGRYGVVDDLIAQLQKNLAMPQPAATEATPAPTVTVTVTPPAAGQTPAPTVTVTVTPTGQPTPSGGATPTAPASQPAPAKTTAPVPTSPTADWINPPVFGLIIGVLLAIIIIGAGKLRQAASDLESFSERLNETADDRNQWHGRAFTAEETARRLQRALMKLEAEAFIPPEIQLTNLVSDLERQIEKLRKAADGSETPAELRAERGLLFNKLQNVEAENRRLRAELAAQVALGQEVPARVRQDLAKQTEMIRDLEYQLRLEDEKNQRLEVQLAEATRERPPVNPLALHEIELRDAQIRELRLRIQTLEQRVEDRNVAVSDQIGGLTQESRANQQIIENLRQQVGELPVLKARVETLEPLVGFASIVDHAPDFELLETPEQQAFGGTMKIAATHSPIPDMMQVLAIFGRIEVNVPNSDGEHKTTLARLIPAAVAGTQRPDSP